MAPFKEHLQQALLLFQYFSNSTILAPARDSSDIALFNWTKITPSKSLKWHNCYEQHECARLEVPMDWESPLDGRTVALAVARLPAQVPRSDSRFGGSIFLNPGGPGGGGVGWLRWMGNEMRAKIAEDKYFELVSWDPRGVENTTPLPNCFDSQLTRTAYWIKQMAVGFFDESDQALYTRWASARSFGQACNGTILQHMTTLTAVQDLLAINDALHPHLKKPLVNYHGTSYGTFIGNTLASAFPERVGKLVLDGVVPAEAYAESTWASNLVDTDHVTQFFFDRCHAVGKKCPLWQETPDLIEETVMNFVNSLKISPLPFTAIDGSPDIATYADIRDYLFGMLYVPNIRFPEVAEVMAELIAGNASAIAAHHLRIRDPTKMKLPQPMKLTNTSWDNRPDAGSGAGADATRIIACTDGNDITHWGYNELVGYKNDLLDYSKLFGALWSVVTIGCVGWPQHKRAADHTRFTGPFQSKWEDYSEGASPILWIGNKADPVTPLVSAREQAAKHEKSVVLVTDLYGHASVPLQQSKCVWKVLRKYFNHGELPDKDLICGADALPWDDIPNEE